MSRIRYVCMSDMHLGSSRSLFTHAENGVALGPSPVLGAFVHCLRSLLSGEAGPKPVLILNGDILEFALASDEVSASAFQHFMELVMQPGEELFKAVWYLPGNHDHHLWEAAREAQFSEFLARHPSAEIPHPWFSTLMLRETEAHPVASPLLTTLLHRARYRSDHELSAGDAAAIVSASYPNLAVVKGDRCVVFHHGHYIEWPYQLLTTLNSKLFGAPAPANVSELEEGNFAWIDFFWSALGRAGDPGENIQYVYDHLTSYTGRAQLVSRVSSNLAKAIRNRTEWNALEDALQEKVLNVILGLLSDWGSSFGRAAYYGGNTAVRAHETGLTEYLERYVRAQIEQECAVFVPNEVTFVFGHTHHPLVRRGQQCHGFAEPLHVYNTGGWVHETPGLEAQIGASLVLVDEDLDATAIELYREIPTLERRYPRVQTAGAHSLSSLAETVRARLAQDPSPWEALTAAIAGRLGVSGALPSRGTQLL